MRRLAAVRGRSVPGRRLAQGRGWWGAAGCPTLPARCSACTASGGTPAGGCQCCPRGCATRWRDPRVCAAAAGWRRRARCPGHPSWLGSMPWELAWLGRRAHGLPVQLQTRAAGQRQEGVQLHRPSRRVQRASPPAPCRAAVASPLSRPAGPAPGPRTSGAPRGPSNEKGEALAGAGVVRRGLQQQARRRPGQHAAQGDSCPSTMSASSLRRPVVFVSTAEHSRPPKGAPSQSRIQQEYPEARSASQCPALKGQAAPSPSDQPVNPHHSWAGRQAECGRPWPRLARRAKLSRQWTAERASLCSARCCRCRQRP